MYIKLCNNGHFYDSKNHDECPYCDPDYQPEKAPLWTDEDLKFDPLADKAVERRESKIFMLKCEKGHYFNKYNFETCPYCVTPDGEITAEIISKDEN